MNIVFNINHLGLEGLGATLTSLIRNCSNPDELKLWLLCSDLKKNDKFNISQLLRHENFGGNIQYIDFDARNMFGHLRPLHGDWTAYGRLMISKYITADSALYLDADLIILLDVLNLKNFEFNDKILGAVFASEVQYALENIFFTEKLKWRPETSYFNSGVVYFNLKQWRTCNVDNQWQYIAEKYPTELLSIDQTLLNSICEGKFALLPLVYNNPWYPMEDKPVMADESILHFVGSPKPWDIFGNFMHKGYKIWAIYNTEFWKIKYSKLTIEKLARAWKIKKSIIRHLTNKRIPNNNLSI